MTSDGLLSETVNAEIIRTPSAKSEGKLLTKKAAPEPWGVLPEPQRKRLRKTGFWLFPCFLASTGKEAEPRASGVRKWGHSTASSYGEYMRRSPGRHPGLPRDVGLDLEGSHPMGKPSPRSNVPKNNEVIRWRVQTPHERQSHVEAMNKKKPRGRGLAAGLLKGCSL